MQRSDRSKRSNFRRSRSGGSGRCNVAANAEHRTRCQQEHRGPRFLTVALQDEFRPSDRWDINCGVRFESYGYALGNYASPEQAFWFNEVNPTACVDPSGLQQVPATDFGGARAGNVPHELPDVLHDGAGRHVRSRSAHRSHALPSGPKRRAANHAGRQRNDHEYDVLAARRLYVYGNSELGDPVLVRPLHAADGRPPTSKCSRTSTVIRWRTICTTRRTTTTASPRSFTTTRSSSRTTGTRRSSSVSTARIGATRSRRSSAGRRNQSVNVSLPGGLSGAFNSGTQKTEGVELAVTKGDPSRNGLSGQFSYTYTYSVLKYALINGSNIVSNLISSLEPLPKLRGNQRRAAVLRRPDADERRKAADAGADRTSLRGRCGIGRSEVHCQSLLRRNPDASSRRTAAYPLTGFYPTYANFFPYGLQLGDGSTALSPNIFAGYLTYKHNKWQVTVTGNLWEGTQYGNPGRDCGNRSAFVLAQTRVKSVSFPGRTWSTTRRVARALRFRIRTPVSSTASDSIATHGISTSVRRSRTRLLRAFKPPSLLRTS